MATTYTTTVTNLYTIPNPAGYVVNAIFEVTGTDGTHTASIGGNCQFTPTQGQTIIPFDQLTQAEVIGWIQSALGPQGIANYEANVQRQINSIENHADDVFDMTIANLFEEEKDAVKIIKLKEILSALETATDKCEDAANVLQSVLVKFS